MRAPRYLLVLCTLLLGLAVAPPVVAQGDHAVFEREEFNEGLPPRPETYDLSTPQSSIESYLAAGAAGDWDLAAHTLDLTLVPVDRQRELGPALARELYSVLDRKVLLRWSDLSERPDALVETGGSDAPLAGEPRRSLLLGILELDDHPVSIRLNRIKPADAEEAVWVFSAPTVDNVPRLFEIYGPPAIERAIPDPLRIETIWGLRLWELLFLPVALGAIGLAGFAVYRGISRIADRTRSYRARGLVRSTRLPLALAVVAQLLNYLTTRLIVVSSAASAVIEPTILLAYVAATVMLVVNAIDAVLDRVVDTDPSEMASPENAHERNLATGISAARRFLLVVALLLGAGIVLSSANIFRTLGFSLLASAGVMTLVIAFAAREVLANILASLQISLNRSARIGDFLEFEGQWCTVEKIHFTYVQLRLWTGNRLIVPVSHFVQQPFENWSHVEFKMLRTVELKLASTADVEPLRDAMRRFVDRDERVSPAEEAFCYVTGHDAFGLTALFAVPVPVPDAGWGVECTLREFLLSEVARLGIELPNVPAYPDAT